MRLIDADELERKVRRYGGNTAGLIPQYELSNAPTVEAIPIEYIKAFKKEFRAVASVKAVIEWLLENWEKENGTI